MEAPVVYTAYRWFVLAILCFIQAVAVAHLVAPATMIGEMSRTMGLDMGEATALAMMYINFFVVGSAIFGGAIIDKFGPYRVWVGGSVILIIGSLLFPICGNTFSGIFIIRAIIGLGCGPIMGTTPLVVAQWTPPHQRGVVMGAQGVFVSFGAIMSMQLVPRVFQKTGSWQTALAAVAGIGMAGVIASLIVCFGPKAPRADMGGRREKTAREASESKLVMRLPATWAVIACVFWFGWSVRIFNDIITGYLAVEMPGGLGLGAVKAGNLMSWLQIVFSVGAILSGFMMELFFRGRARGLVMIGFLLCAVFWYLVQVPGVNTSTVWLPLCIWAGGFGLSITSPLVNTFIAKSFPEHLMGKLGGASAAAGTGGPLVGLGAGSYALHATGLYLLPITLVALGAVLGVVSAFFLTRPKVFSGDGVPGRGDADVFASMINKNAPHANEKK